MGNLDIHSHIESLVNKYLDRSVYGYDSEKRLKDLAIAGRLIDLMRKY